MEIPKEARECWHHSCAAHYCLAESWTQPCTYPDCRVKDYATGKPYWMVHKRRNTDDLNFWSDYECKD